MLRSSGASSSAHRGAARNLLLQGVLTGASVSPGLRGCNFDGLAGAIFFKISKLDLRNKCRYFYKIAMLEYELAVPLEALSELPRDPES